MPRYTLSATTFINGSLGQPGDVVEYGGWPGSSLDPADDLARAVKANYDEMRKRGRTIPNAPDLEKFQTKLEKAAASAPEKEATDE